MDSATSFLDVDVLGARKLSTDGVVVANRNRSEQHIGRGIMMVQQSLVRVDGPCWEQVIVAWIRAELFEGVIVEGCFVMARKKQATTARRRRRRKQPGLHFNPDSYNYALHDETLHEMFSRER
jgi:hypothetical protein